MTRKSERKQDRQAMINEINKSLMKNSKVEKLTILKMNYKLTITINIYANTGKKYFEQYACSDKSFLKVKSTILSYLTNVSYRIFFVVLI